MTSRILHNQMTVAMCGFLQRFSVFILLGVLEGYTAWPSSINIDFYKPYPWDSKTHIKIFDRTPRLPCPTENLRRCVCKSDLKKSMYLVDCTGSPFNDQTVDLRQVPANTTHFNAPGNFFQAIQNGTFENATRLIYLDLSSNFLTNIENIEGNAFAEPHNLTFLDLSHNHLQEPADFLKPLSSLRVLSFILDQISYPIKYILDAISDLKYLEKLAIATNYVSKENVLQLKNTSLTYLSINNVFRTPLPGRIIESFPVIEQGAFSSWESLIKNAGTEIWN